jgi:chorismate mutase
VKRLTGLRGAVCAANDGADIGAKTVKLFDALIAANGLAEKDIVSLVFSATADLDARNPAAALRGAGRGGELAMMAVQEMAVKGAPAGTIRLLAHAYLDADRPPRHVYLGEAARLRPDWAERAYDD